MKVRLTEKEVKQAVKEFCEKSGIVVNDVLKDIWIDKATNKYIEAVVYVNRTEEERLRTKAEYEERTTEPPVVS